jgi:hypothetical protein
MTAHKGSSTPARSLTFPVNLSRPFSRPRLPGLVDGVELVTLGISLAAIVGTGYVNANSIGGLGLFPVTPLLIWVAIGAIIVSFAAELHQTDYRPWRLALCVLGLIVMLDGLPSLIDQDPRFPTAWEIAGFVQAFIIHHHPYPDIDARFYWPGFFTAIGALVGMAGWHNALPLIRWTPVVGDAICVVLVFGIARAALPGRRQAWLVVWGFVLLNWIGQDYFSPQAFAYILFLAAIMIIMWRFDGGRGVLQRLPLERMRHIIRLRSDRWATVFAPPRDPPSNHRVGMFLVLLMISVAMTMEHQLTPVFFGVDLAVLAVIGRSRLGYLPILVAVMVAAWLSYAAFGFWSGNYNEVFGGGGGAAVTSNVTGRLQGSLGHEVVVYLRTGTTLVFWLAAALASLVALIRRRPINLAVVGCTLAPFPVFVVQPYGGEGLLRVYIFTLPFMLCLLVTPIRDAALAGRRSMILLAVLSALAAPAFVLTRFGNEIFEGTRPAEITLIRTLYRIAPKGSLLISINGNVPWRFEDLAAFKYNEFAYSPRAAAQPATILQGMDGRPTAYLLVTVSQIEYAETEFGLGPRWGATVIRALNHNQHFRLLRSNRDGWIYGVSAQGFAS